MMEVVSSRDHNISSGMFKNSHVLMSLSSQLLKQPPPYIPSHRAHYDSGYASVYGSYNSSSYNSGFYGNGSRSSYIYNSHYHADLRREFPVQAVAQITEHSATEIIDVSKLEKASAVVQYANIAEIDGKLYCVDSHVSTPCWLKIITIAKDCSSYNVVLKSTNDGVILEAMRSIHSGEPLLMWFNDKILAMLEMPYLSDLNFEEKKYVCHICRRTFNDPNPLKIHLALKCNKLDNNYLWNLLAQEIRAAPKITVNLFDQVPFTFQLTPKPFVQSEPLALGRESPNKLKQLSDKRETSVTYITTLPPSLIRETASSPPLRRPVSSARSSSSQSALTSYNGTTPSSSNGQVMPFVPYGQALSPPLYGQVTPVSSIAQVTSPDTSFSPTACGLNNLSLYSSSSSPTSPSTPISPVKQVLGMRNSAFKPYPGQKADSAVSRQLALLPVIPGGVITKEDANHIETVASSLGKSKSGHQCIICGKMYSRKYGLKVHIRIHTGHKPLRCKICSRPFGDPSNLNKHVRLHAKGDTPYKCQLCGKILVRRRDLERHMRSRHGDNNVDIISDDMDSEEEMDFKEEAMDEE